MSKKMLSEAEVRRFQGLAGIPAIHQEEGMGHYGDRDEDELPGDEGPGEELLPDVGGDVEDVELADLEVSDEGGEDLGLEPEQAEGLAADIVRAVAQELEDALGLTEPIEVEVEDEVGGLEDLEMDLGEPALDAEVGGDLDLGAPEEEEEELALQEDEAAAETPVELKEDEEEELAEVIDDEEVVNEVLRRVVARLSGKK